MSVDTIENQIIKVFHAVGAKEFLGFIELTLITSNRNSKVLIEGKWHWISGTWLNESGTWMFNNVVAGNKQNRVMDLDSENFHLQIANTRWKSLELPNFRWFEKGDRSGGTGEWKAVGREFDFIVEIQD